LKILIIDNLTETFVGTEVKSGLQRSSKLDAQAFAKLGYDTTYIFCGQIDDTYPYKKISVDDYGAKERAVLEGKNQRQSSPYIKQYLKRVTKQINSADYIIAHCHSSGMITGLNNLVQNKRILFVIHDVVDLMWANGFSGAVRTMRESGRNYCYVSTNSQYSINRLNIISRRGGDNIYSGDEGFDGYIKHFVWTDVIPTEEEIVNVNDTSAVIGRYETHKYHHKLYNYKNPNHKIIHYGMKDKRRDSDLKYYNRLIRDANDYKENLFDKELWDNVKLSRSIILPCFHEGFGYTAFEAGIFGVVPVVLTKDNDHATTEYLTRANVKHYSVDFSDEIAIYKTIDESLNVTTDDRKEISKKLLDYFSVMNYTNERIEILKSAKKRENTETSLESFME
tara:strand:- start:27 stop:1208 length:1182 start_codon:yes stop_codon:yes gene_type:complete